MTKIALLSLYAAACLLPAAPVYAASPIHGPDAVEVTADENSTDIMDHGDFPQSCMVKTENNYLCSSTIISKTQAITAGHCAEGAASVKVVLYCGGNQAPYKGLLRPSRGYKYNSGFDPVNLAKDFAYVSLKRNEEFNAEPMPFASSDDWETFSSSATNECRIAGWGNNNFGDNQRLFYAPITELDYEMTSKKIIMFGHNGGNRNGIDPGDSGGTLMCKAGGVWYLVGVPVANGKNNVGGAVSVMDWSF